MTRESILLRTREKFSDIQIEMMVMAFHVGLILVLFHPSDGHKTRNLSSFIYQFIAGASFN